MSVRGSQHHGRVAALVLCVRSGARPQNPLRRVSMTVHGSPHQWRPAAGVTYVRFRVFGQQRIQSGKTPLFGGQQERGALSPGPGA